MVSSRATGLDFPGKREISCRLFPIFPQRRSVKSSRVDKRVSISFMACQGRKAQVRQERTGTRAAACLLQAPDSSCLLAGRPAGAQANASLPLWGKRGEQSHMVRRWGRVHRLPPSFSSHPARAWMRRSPVEVIPGRSPIPGDRLRCAPSPFSRLGRAAPVGGYVWAAWSIPAPCPWK